MNPLLARTPTPFTAPFTATSPNTLLDFAAIRPEHIAPAVEALLAQSQLALDTVTAANFPADWQQLSLVLDTATEQFAVAWGAISHLNGVADTPELRAAYNAALPEVTSFFTALGADERLYAKYKAIDPARLNAEQQQALKNALRGFQLGGADLVGAAKERYAEIDERLSALSQKFSENVLDATEAFYYVASEAQMAGVPDDVRLAAKARFDALAADDAKRSGQLERSEGFLLTLKAPCYFPIMQYALSSALRETLYKAYATRASDVVTSDQGDTARDNSAVITELLTLKHEQAQLLGFNNHAEVSLAPKMADTPDEVIAFLRDLANRAKPFALQDVADMRAFASETLGMTDPQPWDWTFISERLKEARYAYSESEVKNYFQLPKVLDGLFTKIESLFDVQITLDAAPVWNEKVRFYKITQNGELLAQFYLDTAARDGKRGGAWMDDARGRWLRPSGELQTPVAHLVCNFADGANSAEGDKPALLTHDDVITLFHEFGHGLHHMLTRVNESAVSGISGVEWDAVELPSQFMENFCWEWETVEPMSAHVDSGQAMPRALFEKMLAAKHYQSGLQTLRQVELSLFDMLLHSPAADQAGTTFQAPLALLAEVRTTTAVLPAPSYSRTPHSFSHIFAGGYAAGYYSYKWAEVLSADCYAAFEEAALQGTAAVQATGKRYLSEILQVGGSRPAIDSFVAFRGRKPQIDALLLHQGMQKH